MAKGDKTKRTKLNPRIITQKDSDEVLVNAILSNKRDYLLSESVEEQLNDMYKVKELYLKYGSRTRVIKELLALGFNGSKAAKLADLTPVLFATKHETAALGFQIDIQIEKNEETYRLAKEAGDHIAMGKCNDNRLKLMEKFLGNNKAIDQSKLHLPDVICLFQPENFPDVPMPDTPAYLRIKKRIFETVKEAEQNYE